MDENGLGHFAAELANDLSVDVLEDLELLEDREVVVVVQVHPDQLVELLREAAQLQLCRLALGAKVLGLVQDFAVDLVLLVDGVEDGDPLLDLAFLLDRSGDERRDVTHQEVKQVDSDEHHEDRRDALEGGPGG